MKRREIALEIVTTAGIAFDCDPDRITLQSMLVDQMKSARALEALAILRIPANETRGNVICLAFHSWAKVCGEWVKIETFTAQARPS